MKTKIRTLYCKWCPYMRMYELYSASCPDCILGYEENIVTVEMRAAQWKFDTVVEVRGEWD